MNRYTTSNKELWNRLAAINAASDFYDVDSFRSGQCSLHSIEVEEVGDVAANKMLHLQCHFGMDTLSWARRGAEVTGVDFSPRAISLARELNSELSLSAKFIESDIAKLPDILDENFDIVFTSYGVLCWLPDLTKWAAVIAHFLKPGGVFHIFEMHPLLNVYENKPDTKSLKVRHSYFHSPEPMKWEDVGAYADSNQKTDWPSYEWTHSLADIMNALLQAGLTIEHMHEFPFCVYDHFSFLEKCADGWYRFKDGSEAIPMTFSLKARKNTLCLG